MFIQRKPAGAAGGGLVAAAIVAAILAAIVIIESAETARGATCDDALFAKLEGRYVGQQLGWRSVLEVTPAEYAACRVEVRWETFGERAATARGEGALVLKDGVLEGRWRAGADTGTARFDVLREGELLNGRMMGVKGEPDGAWDYLKAQ